MYLLTNHGPSALGIPPHSHSYFPLSRSLILIPLPFTPLTLILLHYGQARYSSVAALGSLVYQQTPPFCTSEALSRLSPPRACPSHRQWSTSRSPNIPRPGYPGIVAAGVAAHFVRSIGFLSAPGSSSAKAVVTAVGAACGTGLSGRRCRFVDGAGAGVGERSGEG